MTSLNEINFGVNRYCGPSVLSAITGESTDRCAAVISAVTGKQTIKAVQMAHLIDAFKRLRCDVVKIDNIGRTIYGTMMKLADNDGIYVIAIPHHVLAIEVVEHQVFIVDNHTKVPLPAGSSSRLMQKVEEVYKITKKELPQFVSSSIRISRTVHSINIYRVNKYVNEEDNTQKYKGNIIFNSLADYEEIIDSLKKDILSCQ